MSDNNSCYYAIIPANVRYDSELKANEKLLYGEITALTNKTGECWASNNYFAKLYSVTPQAISRWILNLQNRGYITIEYIKKIDSKEIEKRIIKMVSTNGSDVSTEIDTRINKRLKGYQQRVEENNTSNNNTSINKKTKFIPPTLEEIQQYCKERNNNVDAKYFYEYFSISNWVDAKGNKVKNWKQKVITWERYNPSKKVEEVKKERRVF